MSLLKQVEVNWLFTPDNTERFNEKRDKVLMDINHSIANVPNNGKLVLDYTGNELIPEFTNLNEGHVNLSGNTNGINTDKYTTVFTPKYGYEWEDETKEPKEVDWYISSQPNNFILDETGTVIGLTEEAKQSEKIIFPNKVLDKEVKSIGYNLLKDIESVKLAVIPETVTEIKDNAFSGCAKLEEVVIPKTVNKFGSSVFEGTKWAEEQLSTKIFPEAKLDLLEIYQNSDNSIMVSGLNAKGVLCEEVVIPSYVDGLPITSVDFHISHFGIPETLNTVYIPKSVESVYISFDTTPNITDIYYEGTEEEWNALEHPQYSNVNSTKITKHFNYSINHSLLVINNILIDASVEQYKVAIPEGVTTINSNVFKDCTILEEVHIPETVTEIKDNAFSGCTNMKYVYYNGTVEQWNEITKAESNESLINACTIKVPSFNYDKSTYSGKLMYPSFDDHDDNLMTLSGDISGTYAGEYTVTFSLKHPNHVWEDGTREPKAVKWTLVGIPTELNSSNRSKAGYTGAENEELVISTTFLDPDDGITYIPTKIAKDTFQGCANLKSVNIPDSVTSIGNYSFAECTALTTVNIPSGVTSIGAYVFYSCTSLTTVNIPSGVTSIETYTFYNCTALPSIDIPNTVTSIGTYAFFNCTSLVSVSGLNGLTKIDSNAFSKCNLLVSINIPNSVTTIGSSAFSECASLTTVNIPTVTKLDNYAFQDCTSLTTVNISEGVQTIGNSVFKGCSALTSLVIPDSVTTIGSGVFYECTSLVSVKLPNNITTIGASTFRGCKVLASIDIPNTVTSIGTYAFYQCIALTSVKLPNTVTSIGTYAFYGCVNLKYINIPEGVTTISQYTFARCSSLRYIELPSTLTSIENYAFNASRLTFINIPSGVTSIGTNAFNQCTFLGSIIIPNTVTSIGNSAFIRCSQLTKVYYTGTEDQWNAITIGSSNTPLNNATKVYNYVAEYVNFAVTSSNRAKVGYTGAENEELFIPAFFVDPDDGTLYKVNKLDNNAFKDCTNLKSVVIPMTVLTICQYVFKGCTSLETITIPYTLKSIWDDTFTNTPWLASRRDENPLVIVNNILVDGMTYSGSTLVIPDNVTYVGGHAFTGCTNLTAVTVLSAITKLDNYAFQNCTALTTVNIYKGLKEIGNYTFAGCSSLNTINYTGTQDQWNTIKVGTNNDPLNNATKVYNYVA